MRKCLFPIVTLVVLVGVSSVTSVVYVQARIQAIASSRQGAHLLYLQPTFFGRNSEISSQLTYEDIREIERVVPEVQSVSIWDRLGLAQLQFRDKMHPNGQPRHSVLPIVGAVTPQLQNVFGLTLQHGRFLSEHDIVRADIVGVIGASVHERIGGGNVLGETLHLEMRSTNGQSTQKRITIVGVLQDRLPAFDWMPDWLLYSKITHFLRTPKYHASGLVLSQGLQREQLWAANLALNESVLVPFIPGGRPLSTGTAIYLRVRATAETGGNFVVDLGSIPSDDLRHSSNQINMYWPESIAEVGENIREVLRTRLGRDYVFQFLYQGTCADHLRLRTHPIFPVHKWASVVSLLMMFATLLLMLVGKRKTKWCQLRSWVLLIAGVLGVVGGLILGQFMVGWL